MRTSCTKSRGHGLEVGVIQVLCFLTLLTRSLNALSIERDEKDHNLDLIMPGKKKSKPLVDLVGKLRQTSFLVKVKVFCNLLLIKIFRILIYLMIEL